MSEEEESYSEEEEEEVPVKVNQVTQSVKVESDLERRRREADEEDRRKREDKERKKAEVRKRLEEAAKCKKAKKGFMTPERKKKLRVLLRKKATEQLKAEQEKKALERRRIIKERCGEPKSLDGANEATLQMMCKEYHKRISQLEDMKYDLEYAVRQKDLQVMELNAQVNFSSGRFVKPLLNKVKKENKKLLKMNDVNFHQNLKRVESNKFSIEVGEREKSEKPEWALGAKEAKKEENKFEVAVED